MSTGDYEAKSQDYRRGDGNPEPDEGRDVSAFVGKGVEFKGTIVYNGIIRIDGRVEGEIHTSGTLLVGDGAVITAKVIAGIVVCQGTMTGDIQAKERVQLQAPAVLTGSVSTPTLSMEEGVLFNGTVDMTPADVSRQAQEPSTPFGSERRVQLDTALATGQKGVARIPQPETATFVGAQDT